MKTGGVPQSPGLFPKDGSWDPPWEERSDQYITDKILKNGSIEASSMPFYTSLPEKKGPIKPIDYSLLETYWGTQCQRDDDDPLPTVED